MDRFSLAYSTAGDSPEHLHNYLLCTAGDSPEHTHKYLLWRLCRAHGPQCPETLRVVTGAQNGGESPDMHIAVVCGA